MRKYTILFIIIVISSCIKVEVDYGGSAAYYITNNKNIPINVQYEGIENGNITIQNSETKMIYNDFIIGVNPKPSDTFTSIIIYDDDNNVVIQMEQIDNNQWIAEKTFSGDFGLTKYTYIVN